jgi:hypothetical protein
MKSPTPSASSHPSSLIRAALRTPTPTPSPAHCSGAYTRSPYDAAWSAVNTTPTPEPVYQMFGLEFGLDASTDASTPDEVISDDNHTASRNGGHINPIALQLVPTRASLKKDAQTKEVVSSLSLSIVLIV